MPEPGDDRRRAVATALRWLFVAVLGLSAGCASRPDWIQSTLVTTDVTGTWRGVLRGSVGGSQSLTLILEQRGAKVTGEALTIQGGGALEGTVEGDVLRFRGSYVGFAGEVTIAGDEMTGQMSSVRGAGRVVLRRGEGAEPTDQPDGQEKK